MTQDRAAAGVAEKPPSRPAPPIVVVGLGAVGSLLAGCLAAAGCAVVAVGRVDLGGRPRAIQLVEPGGRRRTVTVVAAGPEGIPPESRVALLAVKQYDLYQGVLPASGLHAPPTPGYYRFVEPRSGQQLSWLVLILPQIEQANLHSQFDLSRSVFQQPKEPQAIQVSAFLCPSDSARGQYFADGALTGGKRLAKGNYAAFCSPFHTDLQVSFPGALIATGQSTAAIRDGLSNTLMLSEVRVRANPQDQRGAWALAWTGTSLLAFDMHHNFFLPRDPYVPSSYFVGLAQPPNNQGPNVDMLYACPDMAGAQLEEMPCGVWQRGTDWEFLSAAPRSRHPGGVNVAFADGHVGFLINEVDDFVMAYLISINDRQSVDYSPYVY